MKSFCFVLGCCALAAGAAQAQPANARLENAGLRRGLAEAARGQGGTVPAVPNAAAAQGVPALTDPQRIALRALQSESGQKTTQLAVELAAVVQKIYDNNLLDAPNEELKVTLDNQMKELVWQMLMVKGNSMWAAFRLLTPEQKGIVRTEIAKPHPPGDLPDVMDLIMKTFK